MVADTIIFGVRLIELVAGGFALFSALLGLYIGYLAYGALRRHEDPSMRYLAAGLVLLTAVTYTVSFVGSVLVQLRILTLPQQDWLWLTVHLLQFSGLALIAYALHRRP